MPESETNSYDVMPYRGYAFRRTHPSCLSAIAHLLSLPAVDPRCCRCLELGCCDGGNLIPMAIDLQDSSFMGVDYSSVQIDLGQKTVAALGLKNIELRALSILDITPDWGQFDYIICHGVFSWVGRDVQEKILQVCKQNLSPDGIAFISYNANPGWHMRGVVRDMMRYHAMRFDGVPRRVKEARLILDFVSQHARGFHGEWYAGFLKAEAVVLKDSADHYLYHDHLEDHCEPFYFHQFMDRVRKHGLDYFSESQLGAITASNFGIDTQRALASIAGTRVELEQFMDFLCNRVFRETLLHHGGSQPVYDITPRRLHGLYIFSSARPQTKRVDVGPGIPATFESTTKSIATTSDPMLKAAMICLTNEFPASIQFESLVDRARKLLVDLKIESGEPARDPSVLAIGLLQLLAISDVIEIESLPRAFRITPGSKPAAAPLARLQAESGTTVTNGRHDTLLLDESEANLLKLLDGSRTRAQIAAELGIPVPEVDEVIHKLARRALLVG